MRLTGKVALITGAGSGIGRATAIRFAAEGAKLIIADLSEVHGAETAALARGEGTTAIAIPTDVSRSDAVAELFNAAEAEGLSPDIVVNNAGNAGFMTPLQDVTDAQWDSVVNVHLNGTFYCMREALKRMVPRRSGVIVNLGSVAGLAGMALASAYTASKGAIIALTKGTALEVAKHGIRVNCVAPGFTETPILNGMPDKLRGSLTTRTPMRRIGVADEIAAAILFLASDDSSYVTGQVLSPNGGIYT